MTKMQSNLMGGQKVEEKKNFIPTAIVRDDEKFWRRSMELDKVLGKKVEINIQSRIDFNYQGQSRTSYEVSPPGTKLQARVATNMLSTLCEQTSKLLGIRLTNP